MKSNTTFADVLILNIWVNLNSKLNAWLILLTGCMFSYFALWSRIDHVNTMSGMLVFVIGFGGWAAIATLLSIPCLILVALSGFFVKGCYGEKSIEVDSEAITESSKTRTTRVPWRNVRRISITTNHIFIKIGIIKYIVIPKRDFSTAVEFARFYCEVVNFEEPNS